MYKIWLGVLWLVSGWACAADVGSPQGTLNPPAEPLALTGSDDVPEDVPESVGLDAELDIVPPVSLFTVARQQQQKKEGWYCYSDEAKGLASGLCSSVGFIECEWNPDKSPKCREGSAGIAIWANLINSPDETGVEIYANCHSDVGNLTAPVFRDSCFIRPPTRERRRIAVVVKINKAYAEEELQARRNDATLQLSAAETEIRRGRAFASRRFFDGTALSPRWFDLKDRSTSEWHSVNKRAFIMERLRGITSYEILLKVYAAESSFIVSSHAAMMYKYKAYYTEKDRGMPATAELAALRRAADRTVAEVWARSRYRLSLLDGMTALVDQIHTQGVHHCDLHMSNVMVLSSFTRKLSDVQNHLMSGDAVYDPINLYWTEGNVADQLKLLEEWKDIEAHGVPFWSMNVLQARLIDTAKGIDINDKLKTLGDDPKKLYTPCRIYREGQVEDIQMISRTVGLTLRGTDIQSGSVITKDLDAQWREEFNRYLVGNAAVNRKLHGDPTATKIFEELQEKLKDVARFFYEIQTQIDLIPEYNSCFKNWLENMNSKVETEKMTTEEQTAYESSKKYKCNVLMMRSGLRKLVKTISKAIKSYDAKLKPGFSVFSPSVALTQLEGTSVGILAPPVSLVPMSVVRSS